MFTQQCNNAATSRLPCINPEKMHKSLPYFSMESMLAGHSPNWHPGRRITTHINLDEVTRLENVKIDQLRLGLVRQQQLALESAETSDDGSSPYFSNLSHIATIYIYCPPCKCLIDTAVEVCVNMADPSLLSRLIRIDDRLPCSCFDVPLALESLKAIIHNVREVENSYAAQEHGFGHAPSTLIEISSNVESGNWRRKISSRLQSLLRRSSAESLTVMNPMTTLQV